MKKRIALTVLACVVSVSALNSAVNISAADTGGIGTAASIFYDTYNGDPWLIQSITPNKKYTVIKGMPAEGSGDFSIKITNLDFADTYVSKAFAVKKNTDYRVTAMVKYADFEEGPGDPRYGDLSGANIYVLNKTIYAETYTGTEWKRIEMLFNSGDSEKVNIWLRNGYYSHTCKGSAWFSDVKIEEKDMTPSTAWNMLALVYKDIDANLIINGQTVKIHNKMDATFEQFITALLPKLPDVFYKASGGMMSINKLDVVMIDRPITKIINGGFLAPEDITGDLQKYTEGKNYDQIIALASNATPDAPAGWGGMGAMHFKDMWYVETSFNQKYTYDDNSLTLFVHEILHCLQYKGLRLRPVADLHDSAAYGYANGDTNMQWYSDYMQNKLPDKKGLPPEVFTVYHGPYHTYVSLFFTNK